MYLKLLPFEAMTKGAFTLRVVAVLRTETRHCAAMRREAVIEHLQIIITQRTHSSAEQQKSKRSV